jgi:hypothetical protein
MEGEIEDNSRLAIVDLIEKLGSSFRFHLPCRKQRELGVTLSNRGMYDQRF